MEIIKKIEDFSKGNISNLSAELFRNEDEEYYGIFYFHHKVILERIENQNQLEELLNRYGENVVEFRIFNRNRELCLWKAPCGYEFRIREDDTEDSDLSTHLMIGKVRNGRLMTATFGYGQPVPLEEGEYKISVRNYTEYDEDLNQVKVVDARLVEIEKRGK